MPQRQVSAAHHEGSGIARAVTATLALAVLLLATGCATSGKRAGARPRPKADEKSVAAMTAYISGTNIEIIFPGHREDTYAHASWTASAADTGDYRHEFAVLTFEKQEPAVRRPVVRKGNRVVLRDEKQWQQLVQEVFEGLAPRQTNHGVLLLAQERETVIFRDKDQKPKIVRFINKPPEITVDRTLNERDFSRRVIELLEQDQSVVPDRTGQLLFMTGEDSAFVLVDLQQRLDGVYQLSARSRNAPARCPAGSPSRR